MKNKRLIISWSLLIGWMLLIFFMSNQPADISNKQSDLAINLFSIIGIDLNNHLGEIASFVVRKAAHFTEYFILYCFSIAVCKHYVDIKKARIYCLFIVLGYAISDEIHQYFIPGREMAIRDVAIDFSGGVLGFIVNIVIYKIKFNKRNNCNYREEVID
ncbi:MULTISPECIES: VanZ family protein [unclassified Clostridium]|uniref:VanZ family protein n=1 Tax=unclassified Clostridium TaxID=2614128 RepID=UPI00189AACCF|nr:MULTISPECIES: VanZ family protein [unclassified Clostridium]MBP3914568.1 VanZ family protein [Clostridium sp.]MEE0932633.1 VanZ family protein [Clostridium sp.]